MIATTRFVVISLLSFFLLQPLIRTEKRRVEKPLIVIAQDNSGSVIIGKDSSFYKGEYLAEIDRLKSKLEENYDVRSYTIGNKVREGLNIDYTDQSTDLGGLFEELFTRYYNRNLGAVILATDGIFNQGTSPLYSAKRLKGVPVFTIAMGDTTIRKDLLIGEVLYNRLAYLGNEFPIEVTIDAGKCKSEKAEIKILKGNEPVASKVVQIDKDQFTTKVSFKLEARTPGIQRYRIAVTPLNDELTILNNHRDIFIEVLNSKQKILLLAHSPHPDLNAIRSAISENRNYEVSSRLISDFNEPINNYNLIILHQLPSLTNNAKAILDQSENAGIPLLIVLGAQSSINAFNELKTGLTISNNRGTTGLAAGSFNTGFSLFQIEEKGARQFLRYPPLQIPFGEWKSSQACEVLFNQRIGTVETQFPLVFFNKETRRKFGVIAGEGVWRWKMADFAQNENNDNFNGMLQKSIQYLASRENKSFFRVFAQNEYPESENILINAELYNKSYELINEPEVEIIISNEEKKDFRYIFSRTATAYRLDAGKLPAGQYRYTAKTEFNSAKYEVSGEFSITPVMLELAKSVADHQLLAALAFQTKGEMIHPNDIRSLPEKIGSQEDIVEVVFPERRLDDLLHFRWIFFLILALLTLEWFIRRWSGAY